MLKDDPLRVLPNIPTSRRDHVHGILCGIRLVFSLLEYTVAGVNSVLQLLGH